MDFFFFNLWKIYSLGCGIFILCDFHFKNCHRLTKASVLQAEIVGGDGGQGQTDSFGSKSDNSGNSRTTVSKKKFQILLFSRS
jgi:hypothetical protein